MYKTDPQSYVAGYYMTQEPRHSALVINSSLRSLSTNYVEEAEESGEIAIKNVDFRPPLLKQISSGEPYVLIDACVKSALSYIAVASRCQLTR